MMIYIAFPWFSKYLHVYYHILIICHHKEQEEGTDAAQRTEVLLVQTVEPGLTASSSPRAQDSAKPELQARN